MKKAKRSNKDGLTIRTLTTKDANSYFQIAQEDSELKKFANFFIVTSIDEAKNKISSYTSHYEILYGLFTKSNRLVAVFDVNDDFNEDGSVTSATIHYFVGKNYRGNNYAYRGIRKLEQELSHIYKNFKFEIRKNNDASISVQKKLGSIVNPSTNEEKCDVYIYTPTTKY